MSLNVLFQRITKNKGFEKINYERLIFKILTQTFSIKGRFRQLINFFSLRLSLTILAQIDQILTEFTKNMNKAKEVRFRFTKVSTSVNGGLDFCGP